MFATPAIFIPPNEIILMNGVLTWTWTIYRSNRLDNPWNNCDLGTPFCQIPFLQQMKQSFFLYWPTQYTMMPLSWNTPQPSISSCYPAWTDNLSIINNDFEARIGTHGTKNISPVHSVPGWYCKYRGSRFTLQENPCLLRRPFRLPYWYWWRWGTAGSYRRRQLRP